jgi:hypothetical protein
MRIGSPVTDLGLVRLGAGMRRGTNSPRLTRDTLPPAAAEGRTAAPPMPARFAPPPAFVSDAGRVRLGAGMRRS